jgi:hypothetical protein
MYLTKKPTWHRHSGIMVNPIRLVTDKPTTLLCFALLLSLAALLLPTLPKA